MDRKTTFYGITILLFLSISLFGQDVSIQGRVRDINTHREIYAVNVFVKNTSIGTITDYTGKFSLLIPDPNPEMMIVFQHIGYNPHEISMETLKSQDLIELQPRVIPLKGLTVEAPGQKIEIEKDLPQAVSTIQSESFKIRGYIDAGDLLRTEHSVQVEEEISGKKTVAIRGGNPDEVVVLYNGIKMNSSFDNIFDLSLVDLEDVERFEIIKGSNTALYGSEALSGIVNIVPKLQQDYTIRFQQKVGTYNSGNWGLHFYKNIDRFYGSYSYKEGAYKRLFSDTGDQSLYLNNQSKHHTAGLVVDMAKKPDGILRNTLHAMYIRSQLDYENQRDLEWLSDLNQVASLRYRGDIGKITNLNLSASYRQLNETHILSDGYTGFQKRVLDQSIAIHAEKLISWKIFDFLMAYQFQYSDLAYRDEFPGSYFSSFDETLFHRDHHGGVFITKIKPVTGQNDITQIDFDVSVRHDYIKDTQNTEHNLFGGMPEQTNTWDETMIKLAANIHGNRNDFSYSGFINMGTNVKFPTLFQQISVPLTSGQSVLNPEKNKSLEIGFDVTRDIANHPSIYGYQISGFFFRNYYDNKFRTFYIPGIPVAYYDNVLTAEISGFETESNFYLYKKKLTFGVGYSKYFISEKSAFPFKSDMKATFKIGIDHAGFAFQFLVFQEGEQVGWIRQNNDDYIEVILPKHYNIDLHLGKTFQVYEFRWSIKGKTILVLPPFKLKFNASVRNLLNDDTELSGLALRDRRYYLTMGVQY